MKEKFKKLISDINKMIDKLDTDNVEGPIPYLEEAIENIQAAIEEWDMYFEEEQD